MNPASNVLLPTRLGDDTSALPVPANVTFLSSADSLGAGDTFLLPHFLSTREADDAFRQLAAEIPFQQWFHMAGGGKPAGLKPLSRTKCALAVPQADGAMPHYRFPVNDQQRYPVLRIDGNNTPTLLNILKKVHAVTQVDFNHVVVLLYKDGNDAIGFHKDKTLDLADGSPIVSVSLGAERPYVLRKEDIFHPTETQQFTLPHGSLLSLGARTNADWYHSVIVLKDQAVQPRISITFRKVETFRDIATGALRGKGAVYDGLNWPTALKGNHRTDKYLQVSLDCSQLLEFWFGVPIDGRLTYNGGLWWRGMMPHAQGADERERRAYTDRYILQHWGTAIESDYAKQCWSKSPLGTVAAIVLYDQLPRQAFRGTSKAFQSDSTACALANRLLDEHPQLFTAAATSVDDTDDGNSSATTALPWTFQIFVYTALLHSEAIVNCERGACGLANLYQILKAPQHQGKSSRILPLLKSAKEHLHTLSQFGRYPHRNVQVGRESTAEELAFLQNPHLPTWMRSQRPSAAVAAAAAAAAATAATTLTEPPPTARRGFRVLVLHSNRQSPIQFQRKTRNALARAVGRGSTLVYASAPHKYVAQGEARSNTKHLQASQSDSTRCWWNATDDVATMVYNGIDETIRYIDEIARTSGPFDGIIGFSQGGALAGALAALVSDRSSLVANLATSLQFCVIISGFYVRDTRAPYSALNGPLRDAQRPINVASFHVWGENDTLVLPERSRTLRDSFVATTAAGVRLGTTTHKLDHYAKAVAVWPVDEICAWIWQNFSPRAQKPPTLLLEKLYAMRDKRFVASTVESGDDAASGNDAASVDDRLVRVVEQLNLTESSIVLGGVSVVLLEQKLFPPKHNRAASSAHTSLVALGQRYATTVDWREKVATVLAVFPNAIGAFYVADRSTDVFRAGIVDVLVNSIRQSLDQCRQCDYVAEHLPNKNNKRLLKPGELIAQIVAAFPQLHVSATGHEATPAAPLPAAAPINVQASYQRMLDELQRYIDTTDYSGAEKRALNVRKGARNAAELQALLAAPLSDAILNPTPEPVEIASADEMQHLHRYLREQQSAASVTGVGDAVFPRGTLCADGRLDLCKQVIGPRGVPDLELSLQLDGSSATPKIKHLLLGNNVAGAALAHSVGKMIRAKSTSVTTWYIAGNELREIEPVTEALAHDDQVLQLWLKRNPLRLRGGVALGAMLCTNRCLRVLDLTNTGLLDDGVRPICDAITLNQQSALCVLYLEANGLTPAIVPDICAMLGTSKVVDLCLGCNRLGDRGTSMLANVLHRLEHIDLSSCGIGPAGAKSLAAALANNNNSLRKLDLGLLKSTNALAEVPNAIGNEGAAALAGALAHNSTLLSLNLLHNGIYQQGVHDLAQVLTNGQNTTLLHLNIEQLGIPHNELTREAIRVALRRNLDSLSTVERAAATRAMNREHLAEIKSVYRNE